MDRSGTQSGLNGSGALRLVNGSGTALPEHPTQSMNHRFSDATNADFAMNPTDPRMLIAQMTLTRHQCRSSGLIKRDITELIFIAHSLGLTTSATRKIIDVTMRNPDHMNPSDELAEQLSMISLESKKEKTRLPFRVWIALSIWALTIVLAMKMV